MPGPIPSLHSQGVLLTGKRLPEHLGLFPRAVWPAWQRDLGFSCFPAEQSRILKGPVCREGKAWQERLGLAAAAHRELGRDSQCPLTTGGLRLGEGLQINSLGGKRAEILECCQEWWPAAGDLVTL